MITVKDFLEKITNPDRIKIVKGEEVLFAGYKGALVHEGAADLSPDILEAEMVSFRIDPEIRAKDWKARGLWPRSNRNRRRTISFQIWK